MSQVFKKRFTLRVTLQFQKQVYSEMTLPNVEFSVESVQIWGYTNISQEPDIWYYAVWNDALQRSTEPTVPQNVPQNVRWEYLKESINSLCFLFTGKKLTDEHLNYICPEIENIFLITFPYIHDSLGTIAVMQLKITDNGREISEHLILEENFKYRNRPKFPFSISDIICRQFGVTFGETFGYLYKSNTHAIPMEEAFPYTIECDRPYTNKVIPKIPTSLVRSILIDPNEMIIGDCAPYNNDEENNDNWWSWLNNILTQMFYLGIFLVLLFMIVCAYCNSGI
ncbi:uncharacterized protein LOC116351882 isoform X2 [Contarinia nasturtii]|uniref:uncharacterized protein LOC116351882 isoform X2 n=1 Tax=Contarinia nasturtii TaxID=265458 RepID=UPI0012D46A84|nr:uncharacterized protein LOC116351882 isoform X2 [Contarinia nasturtii]